MVVWRLLCARLLYFDACAAAGQGAAEAEAVAQVGCKCQRSSLEVMFGLASHWSLPIDKINRVDRRRRTRPSHISMIAFSSQAHFWRLSGPGSKLIPARRIRPCHVLTRRPRVHVQGCRRQWMIGTSDSTSMLLAPLWIARSCSITTRSGLEDSGS